MTDLGEEIVQIAMMRGCWFRAEEIFEHRIRDICQQWTDGNTDKANVFYRQLRRGKTAGVPDILAFAVTPLVDMLVALRKGREHVDAAFKMTAAADPVAASGIASEIPEGYISFKEASQRVNMKGVSFLRGAARFTAYARSIRVTTGKQGRPRFFSAVDIEAAKQIRDEELAERFIARMERTRTTITSTAKCDSGVKGCQTNRAKHRIDNRHAPL